MPRIGQWRLVVPCPTDMVSIGHSQVFDSLANLAYLVRDRINPLCFDQETAEALADAENLIQQVMQAAPTEGGCDCLKR